MNPDDKEPTGGEPEPSSPEPGGVWLPPRLRQKLEAPSSGDDFDFLKKGKSSPVGTIITVVVIVAVLAGAFMVYQSNQRKKAAAAAAKAAEERAAFLADSLAQVHMADSLRAVAVAESVAFAALPKWKQRQVLAEKAKKAAAASGATAGGATAPKGGTTTAAATAGAGAGAGADAATQENAAPEEAGPFGIDAGQFLDETKAGEVATDLKGKTGLAATVVPMGEGDDTSYHVVLGNYPHRGAAESKANSLLSKGMLNEASVVALPKH